MESQSNKQLTNNSSDLEFKTRLIKLFFAELERELTTIMEAAFAARDAATDSEAKAENKYDTRGLEASYLAGAQAKRASELRETIDKLKMNELRLFSEEDPIEGMALVKVEAEDGSEKNFFLVPAEGGAKIDFAGTTYFFVTPESPVGRSIWQQQVGAEFELKIKGNTESYEIVQVL